LVVPCSSSYPSFTVTVNEKEGNNYSPKLGLDIVFEHIHVLEAVNGNQGKVVGALAQMMQGMGELDTVSDEWINRLCKLSYINKGSGNIGGKRTQTHTTLKIDR